MVYKCISEMLCKTPKSVPPSLVNESHVAFVQDMSLVPNVLIFHDLMRHYNRRTSPRFLMKIDLRKSCDMVRMKFLK